MKFVQDYFNAEKYESIFFAALGLVAVLIAIYYFNIGTPYYKGIAIPFLLIASIQIVVGTIVYFRSPKDIIMVETMLKDAPQKIQTEEIPRMEVVMKNFTIYRYTEISLLVFGLLLFYFCPSGSFLERHRFRISDSSWIDVIFRLFCGSKRGRILEDFEGIVSKKRAVYFLIQPFLIILLILLPPKVSLKLNYSYSKW